MLAFILTELISRITALIMAVDIQNGKPVQPNQEVIERLDKLIVIAAQQQYSYC